MTVSHAPRPQRRYTADVPVLPYKCNTGDVRRQALERSHATMSSHCMIEETEDSDNEPAPRQASFPAPTLPSRVPSEKKWIDARQTMIERDSDHTIDEHPLDCVKDFMDGALPAFLD
jgi:hypothetical protein